MAENIDLALTLDSQGFVQGARDASLASAGMAASFTGAEKGASTLGRVMGALTPTKVFTGAAVTAAAAFESQLSSMQATAAVTGQNMGRLQGGMAALARQFPIGNKGAMEVVSTLQSIGYSGKAQIKTIDELGKSYVRLGAATGTNASVIGRQMTMLSRAFGAADSDTKRFTKMSDSLTTVTAKIGGSSTDIAAFSKNIAPMARSAGIGQTAVMGISAAFSKMGEDGFAASNAMNKMLMDLNRSVRDGSGEMGTYASIVGKTREEFEGLFKADPTKALSLLTENLGGGGKASERNLERIGLDGPRTARVLQGLSQQGGIGKAAQTAIDAYGDGSTDRASKAATDGLFDQFEKLKSASEQLTEALGRPFLGALTNIISVAGVPVKAGAAVMNTGAMQTAIKYGLPLIIGALGLRALAGLGATGSMGRQLLMNNQMTQGFTRGRNAVATGYSQVPGAPMGRLGLAGYNMGQGFGGARAANREARVAATRDRLIARGMPVVLADNQARQPGPSVASRVRGAVAGAPRAGLNAFRVGQAAYTAVVNDPARQLRTADATMRSGGIIQNAGLTGLAGQLKAVHASSLPLSQRLGMMGSTIRQFAAETNKSSGVIKSSGSIAAKELERVGVGLRALAAMAAATTRVLVGSAATGGAGAAATARTRLAGAASGVASAGAGIAKGAAGLLLNPMMLAMVGGMAMFSNLSGNKTARKEEQANLAGRSISSTLDEYRNSMGAATESTQTFAQQVQSATEALMRSVTTVAQAMDVSAADISYAEQTKNKVVQRYGGDNDSIAEQIKLTSPGGLKPADMQAIKVDLLRQGRTTDDVEKILAQVTGNTKGAGGVDFGAIFTGDMATQNAQGGMDKFRRGFLGQDGSKENSGWQGKLGAGMGLGVAQGITNIGDFMGFGGDGNAQAVGRGNNKAKITEKQQGALDQVTGGIAQQRLADEDKYGADYARQQQLRTANEAFEAVLKTNNQDLIARASQDLSETVGSKDQSTLIGKDDVEKYGSFIQAFQAKNKDFGKATAGVDLDASNGTEGLKATLTDSALTKATDGIALFGSALSNRATDVNGAANKLVKSFMDTPGDMTKFRDALNGIIVEGDRTGMSLNQVGSAALQTVKALGDATSDASKLASAVFEEAFSRNEANAGFQGTAVTSRNRLQSGQDLINSADSTQEGQQRFERGKGIILQEREALRQRMVQRLEMQRQFEKQSFRATRDFNLSMDYAEADFGKNRARQAQQFGITRTRQERDYNLQMLHATQDFGVQRMRANRDFNKQLVRANEDAAKAMYAPFQRIQVQAITDLGTLMVNLSEQNMAIEAQAKGLEGLRKMGVSNDVIDQLGLNKTENAQQLQQVIGDIASGMDPRALNKIIADRMAAAGVLASDSSQKDRQRAKADFDSSLRDQDADFKKSVVRNKAAYAQGVKDMIADYQRGLAQQTADFATSLSRQRKAFDTQLSDQKTDIKDSQKEILGSFEELAKATQDAMAGKAGAFKKLMRDTMQDTVNDALAFAAEYPDVFNSIAAAMPADVAQNGQKTKAQVEYEERMMAEADRQRRYRQVPAGDGAGIGYFPDAQGVPDIKGQPPQVDRMMHELRSGMGTNIPLNSGLRPGAITATGNPSYHGQGRAVDLPADMAIFRWIKAHYPMSKELIFSPAGNQQLHNGQNHTYQGVTRDNHWDHVHWAMAKGGIAKATPGGLKTTMAEAGSNEAVIPLDHRGVAALAQAMTQYMTGPDAQRLVTAGRGDRVTYTGNTFIEDHSTKVTGPITVQAQDPNAMMRALQAKARQANLTATPTRKG